MICLDNDTKNASNLSGSSGASKHPQEPKHINLTGGQNA